MNNKFTKKVSQIDIAYEQFKVKIFTILGLDNFDPKIIPYILLKLQDNTVNIEQVRY